jgi:hypothetical protein
MVFECRRLCSACLHAASNNVKLYGQTLKTDESAYNTCALYLAELLVTPAARLRS